MIIQEIWLLKLITAHLVTDFVLQPKSWVDDRIEKKFGSGRLYLHGLVTGLFAWAMIGWQYWIVAAVILVTHVLIDGWKSYQRQNTQNFIIDQLLHIAVIVICWYVSFIHWSDTKASWLQFSADLKTWKLIAGFVFVTYPAGIIIGQFTKEWSDKLKELTSEAETTSLTSAGKWIGMVERVIVLILVLLSQYSAIGLLVTAKGIIRFSEKDRQEPKTEYLVIGTLLSIGFAIVTGLSIK